jgi:hypothetical protein
MKALDMGISVIACLGGCMKPFGIWECNVAENTWFKMLIIIGRVLDCPIPSVVPGEGGRFHMFFFKGVKQTHICHALRNIGGGALLLGAE